MCFKYTVAIRLFMPVMLVYANIRQIVQHLAHMLNSKEMICAIVYNLY